MLRKRQLQMDRFFATCGLRAWDVPLPIRALSSSFKNGRSCHTFTRTSVTGHERPLIPTLRRSSSEAEKEHSMRFSGRQRYLKTDAPRNNTGSFFACMDSSQTWTYAHWGTGTSKLSIPYAMHNLRVHIGHRTVRRVQFNSSP